MSFAYITEEGAYIQKQEIERGLLRGATAPISRRREHIFRNGVETLLWGAIENV